MTGSLTFPPPRGKILIGEIKAAAGSKGETDKVETRQTNGNCTLCKWRERERGKG